jgi:hypothetical protein
MSIEAPQAHNVAAINLSFRLYWYAMAMTSSGHASPIKRRLSI